MAIHVFCIMEQVHSAVVSSFCHLELCWRSLQGWLVVPRAPSEGSADLWFCPLVARWTPRSGCFPCGPRPFLTRRRSAQQGAATSSTRHRQRQYLHLMSHRHWTGIKNVFVTCGEAGKPHSTCVTESRIANGGSGRPANESLFPVLLCKTWRLLRGTRRGVTH